MIPLQLTLKNFLSYRNVTLNFQGFHTACICGANGAGKSSLLEAITWALWGESRAVNDDDVIHTGADFVRVDFQFILNQQTYRVIRSHPRGKSSQLDFQIKSKQQFRSLSAKGVKTTQAEILSVLKLDHETFINSAYLRQGRADEFMLRKPTERKLVLGNLLKLDQYETLATQAKDLSKEYKGQAEQLEIELQRIKEYLEQQNCLELDYKSLEAELKKRKNQHNQDREILKQLQGREHQRQTWQQQLIWQQNQLRQLEQDLQGILLEKDVLNQHIQQLEVLLSSQVEITENYETFLKAQQEEIELSDKFQQYREYHYQKQQLESQLNQLVNDLNLQIKRIQTQLEGLENQEAELQIILKTEAEIKSSFEQLNQARERLKNLDQLQLQVSPLLQRQYRLESQIERIKAQQIAKLEQLEKTARQYLLELDQRPYLRQKLSEIGQRLQQLDKKKVYQDRVREKGQEKRSQLERSQVIQKHFEQQIEELKQKIKLLEIPESTCPLCEQSLDENHRHQVIEKTNEQHQSLNEKIWILQEEITAFERERQVLLQEYQQLAEELKTHPQIQQQFNQIEIQLESMTDLHLNLKSIQTEIQQIQEAIQIHRYAQEEQRELRRLTQELQRLDYDEKNHSLVRGEVHTLRWAEMRIAKLEEAKRQSRKIAQEKPRLVQTIEQLQQQKIEMQSHSEPSRKIEQLEQFLQDLNYDPNYHQTLAKSLRTQMIWQSRYLDLQKAQENYPQSQEKLQQLTVKYTIKEQSKQELLQQIGQIEQQLESLEDHRQVIQQLEEKIQQQRQQLDEIISQQGKIEQSLQQITTFQLDYQDYSQKLKEAKKQIFLYQELAQAFGKNGIQALMIENILPQLEAESNQILARLTENQLHLQFVTQKSSRGRSRKNTKLIDTLDILIADARGTRTYETYSGGEAFRINFSIRLALAKLLAQRTGTALQMLVIDEGFGTQDGEGCERLIAAINAISSDFACILTITHMPQFKEAFQHRIEVYKTSEGSQLHFSS